MNETSDTALGREPRETAPGAGGLQGHYTEMHFTPVFRYFYQWLE